MKRRSRKQQFFADKMIPVNRYMTLPASEIVNARLEVRPRQETVYDVVDATTGKIWSPRFDAQSSAVLAMETINADIVRHQKTLLDADNENVQDEKDRAAALIRRTHR